MPEGFRNSSAKGCFMALKKKWNVKVSLRGSVTTAAISCLLFLVACGGDSSTSSDDFSDSSSSVIPGSSSNVIPGTDPESGSSSSSVNPDPDPESSNSSSNVIPGPDPESGSSSSNVIPGTDPESSSSPVDPNCSEVLEGDAGWSWDVPKEDYLNSQKTYGTMTDTRDEQVYKTIKIGDQTWMAENLNYYDASLDGHSWCYGAENSETTANCAVTGRLYTWAAAIDSAKLYEDLSIDCGYDKICALPDTVYGVCPPGWHLPTYAEWNTLLTTVGEESIGCLLMSQTGWNNGNIGTDRYGFSALPAGYRNFSDAYYEVGDYAYFWSASEYKDDDDWAYLVDFQPRFRSADLETNGKVLGLSVRCLQNKQ